MKLNENVVADVPPHLLAWLRACARKLNALAGGSVAGRDGMAAAAPTAGAWAQGDEVRNSAPVELGAPGSRYVVMGWVCIAGGEPGSWVEQRVLTGN